MSFILYETVTMNFATAESASSALDQAAALSRYVEAAKKGTGMAKADQPAVIYPQFHVLSADTPTRNMTFYTTEAHKGSSKGRTGQHSFTKPYPVPLLEHHMSQPECGMPPSPEYGRMIDAKLVKNAENGQAHVAGLGEVTDQEGIDQIMTGRWLTGSLGSSVHDASCSICGAQFPSPSAMMDHVHQRGQHYRPRDKKKDTDTPVQRDYISGTEDLDWVQASPGEKNAQQCYTMVNGYQAREYSKVHTPSDPASLVTVADTNLMPGSHFTQGGAPMSPDGASESVPTTALWVPMSPSSRANVAQYGERYIDLVTGREVKADKAGFLFGHALREHLERVVSNEDAYVMSESYGMTDRVRILPMLGAGFEVSAPPPQAAESRSSDLAESAAPDAETPAPQAEAAPPPETAPAPFAGEYCGPNRTFLVRSESCVERGLRALGRSKTLTPGQKAKTRANLLSVARTNGWDAAKTP